MDPVLLFRQDLQVCQRIAIRTQTSGNLWIQRNLREDPKEIYEEYGKHMLNLAK